MAFPKSRLLITEQLVQQIAESNRYGERFCFILGSGASVESGIPSGNKLEMQWMNCIMGESKDYDTSPMDASIMRDCADKLFEDKLIQHRFEEIEAAWHQARISGKPLSSDYYFDIYTLRFFPNERNGYRYLEHIMESCEPSIGYHTLSLMLSENNRNNLVITTNFDSLVEDSLFLYSDKKPLIVSHESLAGYIESDIQRPIIAKVHRGLMYSPLNTPEATKELKDEWREALSYAFSTYTPIVIGYGGGDHSLMSFLEEEDTKMRHGMYWCYREESGLPEKNIQNLVKRKGGYFVKIVGFDALMLEIGNRLYEGKITPTHTEDHLKKQYEQRVQQYNKQWDKLNDKPELKQLLQPMHEAEQLEEEKREQKGSLTARDYYRRGRRAHDEGRYHKALEEYTKGIELEPDEPDNYIFRGLVYERLNDEKKALQDYAEAIKIAPDLEICYFCRGDVYERIKDYGNAIKDYTKAIELNPYDADYYDSCGRVYQKQEKYEEAIELFTKAIDLEPNMANYYCTRGKAYAGLKKYNEAIEDYSRAIEMDSKYALAYLYRSEAYRALGKSKLAEADKKFAEQSQV